MGEASSAPARSTNWLRGSSETVREARATYDAGWRAMIQSEPHGDMRSQAEMTWPLSASRTEVTKLPKVAKFLVG